MTYIYSVLLLCSMLDLAQIQTKPLPLEPNFDLLQHEQSLQAQPIRDLLMIDNQLYFGRDDEQVGKTLSAWSLSDKQAKLQEGQAEVVLDDMCRPVVSGQKLMVAQHDKLKNTTHIQTFDGNLKTLQSTFAGHAVIRSFAVLENGNMIVCAGNIAQTPRAVIGSEDQEAAMKWWHEVQELSAYALFLVGPDFEVIKPLVEAVPAQDARDIESHLRNSWQLRVNAKGNRVLAFSEASPNLLVLNHEGDIIAQVNHPGKGNPYQGNYGSFQTDYHYEAAFVGDNILISDPASRTLWLMNLKNEVVAAYQQPYKVLEFAVDSEHVYFYGFDGDGVQHLTRAKLSQIN